MRKKGLIVLSGVTVAALAAAGWAVRDRGHAAAAPEGERNLFGGLEDHINDVASIHVTGADGEITVEKKGDDWVLAERGGYPVQFEKVKKAVVGIARLEIDERKTSKPENFAALGVQDPGEPEAKSKRIELLDAEGKPLAALVVGDTKYLRGAQLVYVRRDDENQVYLCEGKVEVDAKPTSWIDREVLRLDGERVADVDIVHPDGEEVLIGRNPDDDSQFVIENLPPGKEPKFAGVASSVGTALSYIGLEDVKPLAEVDFTAEPLARATYHCKDGLVVVAETARADDKDWLKLSASYEAPPEPIGPVVEENPAPEAEDEKAPAAEDESAAEGEEPQAGDEAKEGEAEKASDPEKVQKEVEDLNARWSAWAYQIPDYKGDVLARHMKDLLKEPEPEQAPGEAAEGAVDLDQLRGAGETGDGGADGAQAPPTEEPAPAEEPAQQAPADQAPAEQEPAQQPEKPAEKPADGSAGDGARR